MCIDNINPIRGLIEETFRANPLFLSVYVNDFWGVGFFTLTHLITPPLALLAWWIYKRIKRAKYKSSTQSFID